MKKGIKIICFLLFGTLLLHSQDVRVKAVLDSSKIRIGEQVKLDIYASFRRGITIEWPTLADTITGKIDIISTGSVDVSTDKNEPSFVQQHRQILISAYDSGSFAIPAFKFIIDKDTNKVLFTEPLMLEVHTVPTDTSFSKTKDIKSVLNEPFNWKWYVNYIYWGSAAILFIGVTIFFAYYYTKRKKQIIVEPEKPKIPAHITALAALEKIKTEKVWKDGKIKEYYSSVSDAIRLYIEERYNVFALESTTDEIMTAFRSQVIDPESKNKLQQLLQLSDLVKFAKMSPVEYENELAIQNAFDFVNGTKREEEIVIIPEPVNVSTIKT